LLFDKEGRLDNRGAFAVVSASLGVSMLEIGGDNCDRLIFANSI